MVSLPSLLTEDSCNNGLIHMSVQGRVLKAVFLLALVFIIVLGLGCETRQKGAMESSIELLRRDFSESILVSKDGPMVISYCPDNTCYEFKVTSKSKSKSKSGEDALPDFVHLYLFFLSNYFALSEWKKKEGARNVAEAIFAQNITDNCRKEQQRESVKCTAKAMANRYSISVTFVRFDENSRNEVPINLD